MLCSSPVILSAFSCVGLLKADVTAFLCSATYSFPLEGRLQRLSHSLICSYKSFIVPTGDYATVWLRHRSSVCTCVTAVPCYYQWGCSEHFWTCLLVNMGKGFFGYMSKRDLQDHRAWTFTQQGNSNCFKVAEQTYTPPTLHLGQLVTYIFLTLGIV